MNSSDSKDYAPNLDAAERLIAGQDANNAQVILLRAGFLDLARLMKDVRSTTMNLQRLQQKQLRMMEKMNREQPEPPE